MAFAARKNANLQSLIVVMLISKFIDAAALTPLLQNLKSVDMALRPIFYAVHALNDLLMVMLIQYRWIIAALILQRSAYRKMNLERFIQSIYLSSVFFNLLVITDFTKFGDSYGIFDSYVFYENISPVKNAMNLAEALVLTFLTLQTWCAVRKLKKTGRLSPARKDEKNDYSQDRIESEYGS